MKKMSALLISLLLQIGVISGQNISSEIDLEIDSNSDIHLNGEKIRSLEELETKLSVEIPAKNSLLFVEKVLINSKIDKDVPMGKSKEVKMVLSKFSENSIVNYLNNNGTGGVWVQLPPYGEEPPDISKLKKRNVLSVRVLENSVLINGKKMDSTERKKVIWKFLLSDDKNSNLPELKSCYFPEVGSVQCRFRSVISMEHIYATKYNYYMKIYEEIKNAYSEIWELLSWQHFNGNFETLSKTNKDIIKEILPRIIVEL